MAYFPNGSSGMRYQEQWCSRCLHDDGGDLDKPMCPIWLAHMLWNYDPSGDGERVDMLEAMIPKKDDGFPDKCTMFVSTGDVSGQMIMF